MHLHKFQIKKPNLKVLATALIFLFSNLSGIYTAAGAENTYLSCTDIKVVFARGSGVDPNSERDYKPVSNAILSEFRGSGISVSFYELGSRWMGWGGYSYPAPGIGIQTWERFDTSLGALFTGGEYGTYGDSVYAGAHEANAFVNEYARACPNSKIVLAGYSQGAQVVSQSLQLIDASKIFMALTFGDPKLYLPEGAYDIYYHMATACHDGRSSYSDYRAYVPDCNTKEGILGGFHPYRPNSYRGKVFAYCQLHDVICASYIDIFNLAYGHASYEEQGTYARAAKDLFNRYNDIVVPEEPARDVVIILDNTTGSRDLLRTFKSETLNLATKTFNKGGKVSVYYYFANKDDGSIRLDELCGFSDCTLSKIRTELQYVEPTYGALDHGTIDDVASVLRRSSWEGGANKSLVFLTDTHLENPSNSYISRQEVINLTYEIDPVNLYFVTTEEFFDEYNYLAERTGGKTYLLSDSEISDEEFLTSLAEDVSAHEARETTENLTLPLEATLSDLKVEETTDSTAKVSFESDGEIFILTLDDFPLGFTEEKIFTITDLDLSKPVRLCISPVSSEGYRGSAKCIELSAPGRGEVVVPRTPNTGKL